MSFHCIIYNHMQEAETSVLIFYFLFYYFIFFVFVFGGNKGIINGYILCNFWDL